MTSAMTTPVDAESGAEGERGTPGERGLSLLKIYT